MDERDTKGDLYEDMPGKIAAAAGQNGQFRTPRHIFRLMVELTAPTPKNVICDPASGTNFGFHSVPLLILARTVSAIFCSYQFHAPRLRGPGTGIAHQDFERIGLIPLLN